MFKPNFPLHCVQFTISFVDMIQRPFLTWSSQRGISPQSLEEMSREYLVMGLQMRQKEGERINGAIISLRICGKITSMNLCSAAYKYHDSTHTALY